MVCHGQERLHEAWQEPESLSDDGSFARQAEEVLDDRAEALTAKPVECLEHDVRRAVQPSLVHVHGHELAQERTVLRHTPARVIRHRLVG